MLVVQFQKVFESLLAFRVLKQDAEWYNDDILYGSGIRSVSGSSPNIAERALYLRGCANKADERVSFINRSSISQIQSIIDFHIQNLSEVANRIYKPIELKPGIYHDDVLVEVKTKRDEKWEKHYLASITEHGYVLCWSSGLTAKECSYDIRITKVWEHVQTIPNHKINVEIDGNLITVIIDE